MASQQILCVERSHMEKKLNGSMFQGFCFDKELKEIVQHTFESEGVFREREIVEEDPSWLQAIVYGIVTDGKRVLGLWRKERQQQGSSFVETRHNRLLGLACGGHVEAYDEIEGAIVLDRAMERELAEELVIHGAPPDITMLGVLYREGTMFDRVHMGLIYRISVKGTVTLPHNCDEYDKITFLLPSELASLRAGMEGWGKEIADTIIYNRYPILEASGYQEQ